MSVKVTTDPRTIKFMRTLVIDSMEGFLDSGLEVTSSRDMFDLIAHMEFCMLAFVALERLE